MLLANLHEAPREILVCSAVTIAFAYKAITRRMGKHHAENLEHHRAHAERLTRLEEGARDRRHPGL